MVANLMAPKASPNTVATWIIERIKREGMMGHLAAAEQVRRLFGVGFTMKSADGVTVLRPLVRRAVVSVSKGRAGFDPVSGCFRFGVDQARSLTPTPGPLVMLARDGQSDRLGQLYREKLKLAEEKVAAYEVQLAITVGEAAKRKVGIQLRARQSEVAKLKVRLEGLRQELLNSGHAQQQLDEAGASADYLTA